MYSMISTVSEALYVGFLALRNVVGSALVWEWVARLEVIRAESTERPFGGILALRRVFTITKVTPGISRILHNRSVPTTGILPQVSKIGTELNELRTCVHQHRHSTSAEISNADRKSDLTGIASVRILMKSMVDVVCNTWYACY